MNHKHCLTILLIVINFLIPSYGEADNNPQHDLNQQNVLAVLWANESAEYRAICYQCYNLATVQLKDAISKHKKKDKPLAVVVDCDDTILYDGPFQAYLIESGKSYNSKDWAQYVSEANLTPVPGALEFLQFAAKNKCEVFYVPNRKMKTELDGTVRNLKKFNFPFVDEAHMLLRTDSSDKRIRFNEIKKTHNIVLFIGDNLNDMPIGTDIKDGKKRIEITDSHKNEFGTKFIILPNPMYGGWENSLADNYTQLPPNRKRVLRKALLKSWTPEKP